MSEERSYTPYQQKAIKNFYAHRDDLSVQRLGELVGSLYLETSEKKKAQLWGQVEKALRVLKVNEKEIVWLLGKRDPRELSKVVQKIF